MTLLAAALIMTLAAPSGIQTTGGSLAFTAPPAWHTRPASSSMRVAEFTVPRAAGDSEDAELVIYYFGTGAGTVDANIERWIGQIQPASGAPTAAAAKRTTQTVNGLTVTMVDVSGTYVAEVRPGATEHFNKPGFRLRAAVVETPRGPYYVKMTGPANTIGAADDAFAALVASLRFVP
ncbi:MAG TPA: hypothetical protein VGI12_03120 [Vicinamibacterales bacterium]|jgi:hypothetical protein